MPTKRTELAKILISLAKRPSSLTKICNVRDKFPMFPFFSSSDNSSFSRSIAAWELADASKFAMLSLHDQLSNWNRVWTFMIFLFSTKISGESPRKLTGVDCASKTITTEFKDVFQINNFMIFFLNVFKLTTKIRHLCIKHLPCIWFKARVDF